MLSLESAMPNESDDSNIDRRTVMKGAVAAGGVIGGGGVLVAATGAQENDDTVTAEFCDEFTGGPQPQQCISCIEDECGDEEVNPLDPLFTGLDGQCFTPDEIPDGAEFVALKAAQNCYIAPVDGNTTFCLPDGEPDISNATFYRCGGDPTPTIVAKTVTCEELTVTTANIDDGTELTATVTYEDAASEESDDTLSATVEDNQAVFTLAGDLNPIFVVIEVNDQLLDEQAIEADDAPCFDDADPDPDPDPDPKDPKKPENKKAARKKMEKYRTKMNECDEGGEEYERKYETYKKLYEKM